MDALGHVVLGVVPEGIDDALNAGVFGDDGGAAAEDEGGDLLDDGAGDGVALPGLAGGAEEGFAVEGVGIAIEEEALRGEGGADPAGVVVGLEGFADELLAAADPFEAEGVEEAHSYFPFDCELCSRTPGDAAPRTPPP